MDFKPLVDSLLFELHLLDDSVIRHRAIGWLRENFRVVEGRHSLSRMEIDAFGDEVRAVAAEALSRKVTSTLMSEAHEAMTETWDDDKVNYACSLLIYHPKRKP